MDMKTGKKERKSKAVFLFLYFRSLMVDWCIDCILSEDKKKELTYRRFDSFVVQPDVKTKLASVIIWSAS
jgi:hypothetical protein